MQYYSDLNQTATIYYNSRTSDNLVSYTSALYKFGNASSVKSLDDNLFLVVNGFLGGNFGGQKILDVYLAYTNYNCSAQKSLADSVAPLIAAGITANTAFEALMGEYVPISPIYQLLGQFYSEYASATQKCINNAAQYGLNYVKLLYQTNTITQGAAWTVDYYFRQMYPGMLDWMATIDYPTNPSTGLSSNDQGYCRSRGTNSTTFCRYDTNSGFFFIVFVYPISARVLFNHYKAQNTIAWFTVGFQGHQAELAAFSSMGDGFYYFPTCQYLLTNSAQTWLDCSCRRGTSANAASFYTYLSDGWVDQWNGCPAVSAASFHYQTYYYSLYCTVLN